MKKLLIIASIIVLSSCSSYSPAFDYAKQHKDNNYESRLAASKKADAKLKKELAKNNK